MNKIYGHEHLLIQFSLNNFVDVLRAKYINWQSQFSLLKHIYAVFPLSVTIYAVFPDGRGKVSNKSYN